MNPGSEYEPPTNPYQVPGRQFEQPAMPPRIPPGRPPQMPTMPQMPPPPPPRRPTWLLPTLAAALVVLVAAGGVGAYLVYGKVSGGSARPPAQSGKPASQPAAAGAKGPDVCAMLPKEEAERLVPGATVSTSSKDNEWAVTFGCNWVNRRISYGEFWRKREIDVKVAQHKGEGVKTGRSMAQNSYESDLRSGKYGATATPSLDPGEKLYTSAVKDVTGVGDGAFAQYTWSRSKLLWYSYGKAFARVNDFTIEVKFQADQQRKDAQILSNDTVQSITEDNAIREVSGLIAHFAKGVAGWQAKNPNVLAQAEAPKPTSTPSAGPTPSPTALAAFPADCEAVGEAATRLVPEPTTRARGLERGGDSQTECRWLNLDVPGSGEGTKKIRSVLITVHRFTDRAGAVHESGAKAYYATERGGNKGMAGSSIGGITWGRLTDVKGLGDQAYQQFLQTRRGEVAAASGSVLMRKGAVVVRVDFSGHERPENVPTNSPKVKLMSEKEAMAGALTMARAYMAELTDQPVGN
ncbi:hypothetical protein [Nonomuraea basaltis]|uniref:hypothetical protein n=1 Tax=Nonomuraea basaltis TaxID=2495887 RepID=UPI00110C3ED7|nr:hypothetical protein [Nonomuraea basaltis]TMR96030.1 hypothetical protein EJK15_25400 [Nonomuraea basaltis]